MNPIAYVALAEAGSPAGYTAYFPDLPGCAATGAAPAELLANARAALRAGLQARAERAEEWPLPTRLEQVQPKPSQFSLLVDIEVEDTPAPVNISIGEQLLNRLDAAAEAGGSTRSGFIALAVRDRLREGRHGGADFEGAARRLQDELAAMGRKIQDSLGPDSAFSHSMADLDNRLSDSIRKAADTVSSAMARRREGHGRTAAPTAAPADEAAVDA